MKTANTAKAHFRFSLYVADDSPNGAEALANLNAICLQYLPERHTIEIVDFFSLTFVKNSGVSLGLLTADGDLGRWLLVAMTAAIAIFVALWLWREKRRDDSTALAFVLGGALGNIVDRVRLSYVLDFADLHFGAWRPFLVFNVGDAAITIGVLLLLVRALLMRDGRAKKKES